MAADTFSGNTIFIDLGLERGEPDTYLTPTRSTVPRWFAPMLIALAVLISSAASAAPPPPPLSTLLSLRIGPADSYAVTDDGQLLAQSLGTLSMYDLGSGALRWRSDSSVPTYRLRTGGGLVLMRPGSAGLSGMADPGTTAVSLADGVAQWRRAGSVVTLAGGSVLLAVTGVSSLAGYGRRVQGPVDLVDPITGQTRWQVNVPSTAALLGVPGPAGAPPRMLLVHDDRTAAVHDLATGALLATGPMPPANYGPDNPIVSGGLVLLEHPGVHGLEVSAYDPVTLGLRWSRPAWGAEQVVSCGALACLAGDDGVRALDPNTGEQLWYRADWRGVEQHGGVLVAFSAPGTLGEAVGIIDPGTGRVLVDLHGWRALSGSGGGDRLVVTRMVADGARTMVAVAEPGDERPRPLAELPAGTGDCQAAPGRLVCRSMTGDLVVWAWRQRG
jgi:hypothetical protein